MSTALDIEMAAAVLEILGDVGVPATITTYTKGGFDPSTGDVTNGTSATAIDKVSPPIFYEGIEIDGVTVLHDDFKVIVGYEAGLDIKPADDLAINGMVSEIKRVDKLWSGEDIAAYICHCGKGV